ncbi:hypothetical protein VYU27_001702 [Nannochloropsis oceanica]
MPSILPPTPSIGPHVTAGLFSRGSGNSSCSTGSMYFFTSSEGYVLYMGKDKYENEELIRFGLPEDVWFHVDDLSSAHVYLRQKPGEKLDDISPDLLLECASLVKANSIEGCKKKEVQVVYTRWRNLKKTKSMEAGQIGFHDQSKVRKIKVEKCNSIVNALNRTKEERFPDLQAEQEVRAAEYRAVQKSLKRGQEREEREERKRQEEEAKLRSYESLMKDDRMESNKKNVADVAELEEDFM